MASSAQYLQKPEERTWTARSVLAAHDGKASPSPLPRKHPETFLSKAMASSSAHPCMNGQACAVPLFSAHDRKEAPSSRQEPEPFLRKLMASSSAHLCIDGCTNGPALIDAETPIFAGNAISRLSGSVCAAFGRARAGKRKSRASSKVPIRVFSTDAANFMAMVHKLTGIQSTASFSLNEPFNPLISHLPSIPAPSTAQGMLSPRVSAISRTDTEELPKSWPHFFHEISPFIANKTNVDEEEASAAKLPNRWQHVEEHRENGHLLKDLCHGNSFSHTSITNLRDVGRNLDKDSCRGSSNWDFL